MIANNSSGAHAPVYGTTADHLTALEVVLTDGTIAIVGAGEGGLTEIRDAADRLLAENSEEIARRLPAGLVKRWPGYGLDRALRSPGDLTQIVAGSEGTLAGVVSAVLRVVPRPARRSLGVIFFASVEEALQATVEISDLEAAAIEHLDAAVFRLQRLRPPSAKKSTPRVRRAGARGTTSEHRRRRPPARRALAARHELGEVAGGAQGPVEPVARPTA